MNAGTASRAQMTQICVVTTPESRCSKADHNGGSARGYLRGVGRPAASVAAQRMASRPEYLYIAVMRAVVRYLPPTQGRALLTRHDGTSAMLPGLSPWPRMKDGLVCAAEVIWQVR